MLLGLLATVAASAWALSQALQSPSLPAVRVTPEDAARAQQKLGRLVRGGGRDPVVLTEAEINAFVSRNIDRRDLPFDEPLILLRETDVVEIVGRVSIERLFSESPIPILAALLPERWRAREVWLQVAARTELERAPRRHLRLHVRRVMLGQQRLPAVALRLFVEPARLRFLRVMLPETVAEVRIEGGRAIIRPTSSRERT